MFLPEVLRSQFAIPFYFGGTSLLIVVSVTMDTITQIQSHMLAYQYEGLIERSKYEDPVKGIRKVGDEEFNFAGTTRCGKRNTSKDFM